VVGGPVLSLPCHGNAVRPLAALHHLTGLADGVTIDRDRGLAIRAALLLAASGLVLGRAVAGDWVSAWATVFDFGQGAWPVLVLAVTETVVARLRPRAQAETPVFPDALAPLSSTWRSLVSGCRCGGRGELRTLLPGRGGGADSLRSRAPPCGARGCKWDPQYEDVPVLSPVPLVLEPTVWEELATAAEALAAEALAAERELLSRRDLHRRLGLPRAVRRALAGAERHRAGAERARVLRLDFHWTTAGWRISEANTDVPGGYVEAAGFTELVAQHFPGTRPCGDPASALASAVARAAAAPVVALVHATSYADDRQVMELLGRRLREFGLDPQPVAPDHLAWKGEQVRLDTAWSRAEVGAILRFFPAEWLPQLPRTSSWRHYFAETVVPQSNPGAALLTQSKRWRWSGWSSTPRCQPGGGCCPRPGPARGPC